MIDMGVTEPMKYYSNIQGGVGILGGYSLDETEVDVIRIIGKFPKTYKNVLNTTFYNMKKLLLLISLLPIIASAQAQEPTDSVESHQLNEVVVQGLTESASSNATTYLPSSKQKNASQNGYDLLYFMGIPQIKINPMDLAVTDNTGGPVSIFINYMPASQEEMFGLYPENVRKVEYLESPIDPRFRGAPRVINIIVQEYAYGGYTKLTASETFVAAFMSDVNLFSKFTYKKMTYDIFAGATYADGHHAYTNTESTFTLKDDDGGDYTITRGEYADNAHGKGVNYPITLRATYNTEKIQIRNTIGFSHSGFPLFFQSGKLTFSPGLAESYTYQRNNPNRSNKANYEGIFFFVLPNNFSINATPTFKYSHNDNYLNYFSSRGESIIRDARENAYNFDISAYINKHIGNKHVLMLGVRASDYINRLNYSGNVDYSDRYYICSIGGEAAYQLQTQKVRLYTSLGIAHEETSINKIKHTETYPFAHLQFQYSPNSRSAFYLTSKYVNNTPEINAKSSDVLQENEFLYITGNPNLKNYSELTLTLGYTWFQSNNFDLNAYAKYHEMFDRAIRIYEPFDGANALLRKDVNNGNFIDGRIGVSASLKLLDNSLQFYLSPQMSFYRSTGIYDKSYNPFQVYVHGTYYLNNFYFQAIYRSPDNSMFDYAPATKKSRNYYALIVGWGNSNWNLRLSTYNVFNKKWANGDMWITSPLYTEHRETFGDAFHAKINVSVTYTFEYGKKLQKGDEVGAQSGANSAIIKN